jgi:hypothetical protein
VRAYLTERAAQGVSFGTLSLSSCAIAYQHRRSLGTAPFRQARPLTVAEIRAIVTRIDRTSPHGARDAALILVGFASALRRSELAALTLADLQTKPSGLLLTIRRFKTDPDRRGQVIGVARGRHRATEPVAAVATWLATWLAARGSTPGPLFTSVRPGGPNLQPISGDAIAGILRTRAGAAGLPTARITGHPCAPATPPAPPWPAPASNASPPRPDTGASTSSSGATSALSKPCTPPPAATSASEWPTLAASAPHQGRARKLPRGKQPVERTGCRYPQNEGGASR